MSAEQMLRIAVAFARATATPNARLCTACTDVLHVSGAGITIMGGEAAGPLCVSDDRMGSLEELQFVSGEGPCRDAFASGRPVLAPRMDAVASLRWPCFVDLAIDSGIGAVFAYPLSSRGASVGVLTLYQQRAGDLSEAQQTDSEAVAEVLTETLLSMHDDASGELAPGIDAAVGYRAEIHQASGMVAVQLRISTADALARIRAYAFSADRPIDQVASDIVQRRLRLDDDRRPGDGAGR